ILPALLFDESIPLTGIEPFHASRWHLSDPSFSASVIPCPPIRSRPAPFESKGARWRSSPAVEPIATDAFNDGFSVYRKGPLFSIGIKQGRSLSGQIYFGKSG